MHINFLSVSVAAKVINSLFGLWVLAKDLVFESKTITIIENVEANYNFVGINIAHASVNLKNVVATAAACLLVLAGTFISLMMCLFNSNM